MDSLMRKPTSVKRLIALRMKWQLTSPADHACGAVPIAHLARVADAADRRAVERRKESAGADAAGRRSARDARAVVVVRVVACVGASQALRAVGTAW